MLSKSNSFENVFVVNSNSQALSMFYVIIVGKNIIYLLDALLRLIGKDPRVKWVPETVFRALSSLMSFKASMSLEQWYLDFGLKSHDRQSLLFQIAK